MVGPDNGNAATKSHTQASGCAAMSYTSRSRAGSPSALNIGAMLSASAEDTGGAPSAQQGAARVSRVVVMMLIVTDIEAECEHRV